MGNVIQEETYTFIEENLCFFVVNLFSGLVENFNRIYDKDGYVYVNFNGRSIREHHIISCHIFGERMVGKQINHINGVKHDNTPKNLEVVTPSENIRHAFETGLKKAKRGEESTSAKITEMDVVQIRKRRNEGETLAAIGNHYGLSFQQVSRICSGERWGHVPMHFDEDLANMDFNKYQSLAKRTANIELSDFDEVANYALGLVSEAAEVTDNIKKELFHQHKANPDFIKDELSDVMWYMANLADKYGLTLKEIAIHNILKLKERYPEGFSTERSVNRERD